jgi:hypothetical protein
MLVSVGALELAATVVPGNPDIQAYVASEPR